MAEESINPSKKDRPADISRRHVLRGATTAAGGLALAAQAPNASAQAEDLRTFRAFVRYGSGAAVQELKLRPITERQVVVRTEATQCCFTICGQALGASDFRPARILGHGGVGLVEAVGAHVRRVQVGDRVVVANTPQCGQCYHCLRGRGDMCQQNAAMGEPLVEIADMADGTPVVQHNNTGGFGELMVPYEEFCVPVWTSAPAADLAMLGCVGATGLGAATRYVPVEPGSDVAVIGAGPVGLSAIQGARIMGAAQIIVVEPIRARRELALKLGATVALDPNVEGENLVARIRELCQWPTPRKWSGGRDGRSEGDSRGPDFTFEAIGANRPEQTAESGPDPTGILPVQQAWEMTGVGGHLVTMGLARGEITFRAGTWQNRGRTHHAAQYGGTCAMSDLPRFVRLVDKGLFDAASMATASYPLERTREAFIAVAERSTVGAVVVFPG